MGLCRFGADTAAANFAATTTAATGNNGPLEPLPPQPTPQHQQADSSCPCLIIFLRYLFYLRLPIPSQEFPNALCVLFLPCLVVS